MVFVGVFSGLTTLGVGMHLLSRFGGGLAQRWYRSARGGALQRRATVALTAHKSRMLWPVFLPMLNPIWLLFGGGELGIAFAAEYFGSYLLGFAFSYVGGTWRILRTWRQQCGDLAAHWLVRRETAQVSFEILRAAARDTRDDCHRLSAVKGLRALGTEQAMAQLELLRSDPDVSIGDAADEAFQALKGIYAGANRPLASLSHLVAHARQLEGRGALPSPVKDAAQHGLLLRSTYDAIEDALFQQVAVRRAYPHVFCSRCWTRAVLVVDGDWNWVECRLCGDADPLVRDVRSVVGVIGAGKEWEQGDGVLRVSLWDMASQKARAADLDRLEIVPAAGLAYDWALSACVERLHSSNARLARGFKVTNLSGVPLDPNSERLATTLRPTVS